MPKQMLMKDGLGKVAIDRIALALHKVYAEFNTKKFIIDANKNLDTLELKQRVNHIIRVLKDYLPNDFNNTAKILCKIPTVWQNSPQDSEEYATFRFAIWPIIDYVSVYGIDYPEVSLKILEKLTPLYSAEFAIRAFITKHPAITFKKMETWVTHKDEHVRRLVSEGLRPRLPWGLQLKRFVENPKPILPFLEKLKNDSSLYVRRSVANNLNDVSKDHPIVAINVCQSWKCSKNKNDNSSVEKKENIDWIIRHALRSLIKNGNAEVFPLLGYTEKPKVHIEKLKLSKKNIALGDDLRFSCRYISKRDKQKCVLDYAIYFVGSNGQSRKKVFKLKNLDTNKDEILDIEKKHSFKQISTRKYYPGKHILAIHINGIEYSRITFNLKK